MYRIQFSNNNIIKNIYKNKNINWTDNHSEN